MDKDLYDFAKGLKATAIQPPPSTESVQKITPKAPEIAPKEKTVPPPTKPSATSETPAQKSRVPSLGKKPEKMSKKKIVSRNAAIALVLVLVLLASLVSVIAIYVPMVGNLESQIAEKDNTISELNTQILAFQSTLNETTNEINTKNDQISALTRQLNATSAYYNELLSEYDTIIALGVSAYLLNGYPVSQDENSSTVIWEDVLQYAGYVTVQVQSTSNTTYAEVAYSSYGVNYYNNVTLGTSGGAAFPVLPGDVYMAIGNTDVNVGNFVNATVTAVYYY